MTRRPPYEWVDPWAEAEEAEAMRDQWDAREEYFRQDMRMAQAASHDVMYAVRRTNEKLLEALADSTAGKLNPPIFVGERK